jgi:sugar phosphate isomerase/epimerase
MPFERIGINLSERHLAGEEGLSRDLAELGAAGPDFVELALHGLGVVLGGRLDEARSKPVEEVLKGAGLAYTIHAPHAMNLMDPVDRETHRGALEASVRFAGRIGAPVVVCHAGRRLGPRDARYRFDGQLAAEREALRSVGDVAGELGVTIAVENSFPEVPMMRGVAYAYAVWPSALAEQVAAVDHEAVGLTLDVGHAAVAASFFGFDFLEECAGAAPLVRHLHLHDNLGRPDPEGESRVSERLAYGIGDLHLPPGRGEIPLRELFGSIPFPGGATSCCVELHPSLRPLASEALASARKLLEPVAASY